MKHIKLITVLFAVAMLVGAVFFSGLTAARRAPLAGASADFAWDSAVEVVVAGRAERRWVRVGRSLPDGLVEVLAGLSAGDQVLVPAAAPDRE